MGGIELRNGDLFVERDPNELDDLAIEFTAILDDLEISHVYVAGYTAVLTGRPRSTQDVDALLDPQDESSIDQLVTALENAGMWGPAMPLEDTYEMLSEGDNIWIAPEEQVVPHIEATFAVDEPDRYAIRNALTAHIGEERIPIGPFELQIAYKLFLGTQQDFEDAVHLYTLFEPTLRITELERWVEKLDVEAAYERLRAT